MDKKTKRQRMEEVHHFATETELNRWDKKFYYWWTAGNR